MTDTWNFDSLPETNGEEGTNADTEGSDPEKRPPVGYIFSVYKHKKIKEIKTSFHEEEVGDGLLILETHYFSDICKLQLLCAAAK